MDPHRVQIDIDPNDASWKHKIRELKNAQVPREDAASQEEPMHKELVLPKNVIIPELYKAVENGNADNFVDVLEQVCERRKLPPRDIFQETVTEDSLLHVAANLGREEIAELICDEFPGLLTGKNTRGDTVLHAAVRSKNCTVINLILSKYAIEKAKHDGMKDIAIEKNKNGDTPLHEAVNSKDLEVVKVILDATDKDLVHCLNKSKRSPLFLAVVSGNVEIVNLLLEIPFPADKPVPQCYGNSPLHAAILHRNPVLIREIHLKKSEVVYLKDEDGNSSLHYAACIGYVKGCHILLKASLEKLDITTLEWNKKGCRPIHLACKMGHVKVVEEFLQHEWFINFPVNQKGQNILHVAAKNGRTGLVKYLLRHPKMDELIINQNDNDGNTPLHLASKNLFPQVLRLFSIDKRVNKNLLNNNNLTARDTIMVSNSQGTCRKFLAGQVLSRFPSNVNRRTLHSEDEETKNLRLKDKMNIYLVVSTLMVTVTYTAALAMPGGVYSSDGKNPEFAEVFRVFTVLNAISMFSSVGAVGLLLGAILAGQEEEAEVFTTFAGFCLIVAFVFVPTAFLLVSLNLAAFICFFVFLTGIFSLLLFLSGVPWICLALAAISPYDKKPKGRHLKKRTRKRATN